MRKMRRSFKMFLSSVSFFIVSVVLVFGLVFGVKYICEIDEDANLPIYRVDTQDKKVALSFDVAWGKDSLVDILDVLDKYEVKSTFFLVGSWIDENNDLVKMIDERGHEIGNHSNTHANINELSDEDIVNEIEVTSQKIFDITGKEDTLYRPPFGDIDENSLEVCKSLGYQVIKWDVDSLDWKEIGTTHLVDKVVKESEPGSIVLFHANAKDLAKSLDLIIPILQQEGYEIVPISSMLYKDNYTINSNGEQKMIEN